MCVCVVNWKNTIFAACITKKLVKGEHSDTNFETARIEG